MFDNQAFQKLVESNALTGEVVANNSFIVQVKGLEGVRLGSEVLFEDGQRGFVREAYGDKVTLFNIDSEQVEPGTLCVVQADMLGVPVGPEPWTPEAVGFLDLACAAYELASVVGCLGLARTRPVARYSPAPAPLGAAGPFVAGSGLSTLTPGVR